MPLRPCVPLLVCLMKATLALLPMNGDTPVAFPPWLVMPLLLWKMPALLKMHRASSHSWTASGCSCFVWEQLKWLAGEAVKVGAGKEWWGAAQCVFCWFRFVAVANIWWFILHNWTSRWIRLHGDLSAMQMGQNGSWNSRICVFHSPIWIFFQSLKWRLARGVVKRNSKKSFAVCDTSSQRKKRKGKSPWSSRC